MKLDWIKTTECPDCGCTQVIAESIDKDCNPTGPPKLMRHTNGQTWEKRVFLCGLTVTWVPNFSAERRYIACQQSAEAQQRAVQVKELRDQIDNLNRQLQGLV